MADPEARVVIAASDTTGRAFASADRNLKSFAGSVRSARSLFAGFGVVLSARMFSSWIRGALDAKNMTEQQIETTKKAREAFTLMRESSNELARSLGDALAPALTAVAHGITGLAAAFFGADPNPFDKEIRSASHELDVLKRKLDQMQRFGGYRFVDFDQLKADIAAAEVALDSLKQKSLNAILDPNRFHPTGGLEEFDLNAIRAKQTEAMRSMPRFGGPTEEQLRAAQQLTEKMKTDVEKMNEEWREAKALLAGGLISGETLRRLDEDQLKLFNLNEIRARYKPALKDIQSEAQKVAESIGENFRDAFSDWIVGADRSFKDLLKRMAADMVTSALFKTLGSFFAGKSGGGASFLSSFFGGARASGGPVSAGQGYLVGERGPELFMPGMRGTILPNSALAGAGGATFTFNNSVTVSGGGNEREIEAAVGRQLVAQEAQTMAKIAHLMRRGRFAT